MTLHLIAAGASRGLVTALQSRFAAETGSELAAVFAAAGAVRDRVQANEPCDVVILTGSLLAQLGARGLLAGSVAPIGVTRTGVAVPAGKPVPDIDSAQSLSAALQASRGVYVPDPHISTAGIHFMRVLRELDIERLVMPNLRPFPNGATAMHALASATEEHAIGCTQITEIMDTPGLTLAGALPGSLGLSTLYAAGVATRSTQSEDAHKLVALLTGPGSEALRHECGFEPPSPADR